MTAQRKSRFASAAEFAGIILAIALVKTAIAEPFYVPSGSMEPTLQIGDELLATKYPYGYGAASLPFSIALSERGRILPALPERGDVVVFRWPGDRSQTWVKRVIGLPGDRIALREGRVWINGQPVGIRPAGSAQMQQEDGSLVATARFIETLPGGREHFIFKRTVNDRYDTMPETVVAAGHLFVMGDNRDHSADSRVPLSAGGVGMLPADNLAGRVEAVVGSWDFAVKEKPLWQWPSGLRLSRFFSAVH